MTLDFILRDGVQLTATNGAVANTANAFPSLVSFQTYGDTIADVRFSVAKADGRCIDLFASSRTLNGSVAILRALRRACLCALRLPTFQNIRALTLRAALFAFRAPYRYLHFLPGFSRRAPRVNHHASAYAALRQNRMPGAHTEIWLRGALPFALRAALAQPLRLRAALPRFCACMRAPRRQHRTRAAFVLHAQHGVT